MIIDFRLLLSTTTTTTTTATFFSRVQTLTLQKKFYVLGPPEEPWPSAGAAESESSKSLTISQYVAWPKLWL